MFKMCYVDLSYSEVEIPFSIKKKILMTDNMRLAMGGPVGGQQICRGPPGPPADGATEAEGRGVGAWVQVTTQLFHDWPDSHTTTLTRVLEYLDTFSFANAQKSLIE